MTYKQAFEQVKCINEVALRLEEYAMNPTGTILSNTEVRDIRWFLLTYMKKLDDELNREIITIQE